jgi:hypothetical protein
VPVRVVIQVVPLKVRWPRQPSPLSSSTMVKSMSVHGALVLVKLRVGLNGRGFHPPSRTPCGYISQ